MDFSDFKSLVIENRTCRRFDNQFKLEPETLENLVDLARQSASAANMQPLKYILSTDDEKNDLIFKCLGWAAYLPKWKGPEPSERPTGYIIILADHSITEKFWCDHGISAQTMLLGARSLGLAGCMFGSINQKKLQDAFDIPDHLEIKLVVAIGKPVETVVIEPLKADGNIKYYRDEAQVHHVPKRALKDIIVQTWGR